MKLKDLEEALDKQNKKIDSIVEMVDLIAQSFKEQKEVKVEQIATQEVVKETSYPPEVTTGLPPPSKWRRLVDQILGTDFGLEVDESSSGNYVIKVSLPTRCDRRVGDKIGLDVSTGLVRRSSDLADVELWCKKIKENILKTYPNFK